MRPNCLPIAAQLCLVLTLLTLVALALGEALVLVPWEFVFEVVFRLLGLLALGPHMRWVGRRVEARRARRRQDIDE